MNTELTIVRSLISIFNRHRPAVAASVVLGILSSFAEGIGVVLFIPFVRTFAVDPGAVGPGTINPGVSEDATVAVRFLDDVFSGIPPETRLLVICLAILGAVFAKVVLYYLHGLLLLYLDWKIGHQIRSGLTNQILSIGFRYLEKQDSGELLNTLSTESWNATDALSVILDIVITISTLLVYLALLFIISPKLTLLALAVMLLISLIVRLLTRRVKALGKTVTSENAALATRMLETVEGNKLIRTFGREKYEQSRFDDISDRLGRLCCTLGSIKGLVHPVYELAGGALLMFILLVSARDPATLGSALIFMFALYRVQPRMAALDGARVSLRSHAASIDAVTSLLSPVDKPYLLSGPTPFTRLRRGISFDRASFQYNPDDTFAIHDLSVRFPAGKTTALVGPSGSGKSTLIKLLLRLYEVEAGAILVDGLSLRSLDLASWREKIAVVSQDVFVFNATVRDNIAYGRLDASDEDIVAAAKQANAHDFIVELPQGYLTKVGDRGVRLSGGQLQRLTLARAIVRDPAILILDEATNSLDAISEHLIQEALETLSVSRTVIIIAHRFSTIERADHIIVLEHGRLREQGSLDSLLTQPGLFHQLYTQQHRGTPSPHSFLGDEETLVSRTRVLSLTPDEPRRGPLDEPLISIVIPCYEQARYLDRAIESALCQTYRRTEIIVVNDGSSDATAAVAARYPSVTYIVQPHRGLATARNVGADASHGDLLVFLDADDRLLPNALDLGLECLRAHPACGFVFGAFKTVQADAGIPGGGPIPDDVCLPPIHHDMYLAFLSRNCVGMHGTALFRRTAILAAGKYDTALKAAEDYDLYLKISRRLPVACHHDVIAEYWRHAGNMSLDSGLMLSQCLRVLRKQRETLQSAEQRAALRQGIRRVQNYYGSLQWHSVTSALRRRSLIRSARLGFVLLRYAPHVFIARVARALTNALRRGFSIPA